MSGASTNIKLHPSRPKQTLPRPPGFKPLSVAVGLNGEAIRLLAPDESASGAFATIVQPRFASFPKTRTENDYPLVVIVSDAAGSKELNLSGLTAAFRHVEMLPGGEVLVVAARCRFFRNGGYELNAKVYDSSGSLTREFLLGDGISHVQADARGNIWVGYFDEGVYGNFGWTGANSLGSAGLSCFSNRGEKLWDFRPPEGFGFISDCYALNVSSGDVWAYYYTDFPLIRVDANWQVRGWETESAGGTAFAIGNQRMLLYGGYRDQSTACKLLNIGDDSAELTADVSLALPDEVDLSQSKVIGRDTELHVFFQDHWYQFSIKSLG
jgi:hypothetical protein